MVHARRRVMQLVKPGCGMKKNLYACPSCAEIIFAEHEHWRKANQPQPADNLKVRLATFIKRIRPKPRKPRRPRAVPSPKVKPVKRKRFK